ncbi:single-stranded DNA-binding protein [Francisella sp. TX07-6608]|uniref:single-stranded DNA-binding protein n=1 Tax=Francisella sp. TX07-6608 TaxID=573568 RepID=UPI0008F9AF53|nr:single-stranded DNA-binding protein [Francisella sp. TX07-6608]OIN82897.1 single-stranded DNA-binding family protein [Francisella sp. TX07-6608]OIN85114.1 single-stranded DNA-binding family protein [Francisella sp. TX07-6608]
MAKGTVNKVILLGRLGANPEVRQTQNGTTVATVNLATNEVFKDETQTEWHRVVIFGKSAEVIQQYCKKGDSLYVEGRVRTNKWQDNSGENKYSTEIVVSNFQLIGGSQNNYYTPDYDSYPEAQNSDVDNTKDSTPTNNDYAKAKGKDKIPSFNEINNSNFDPDDIPF